MRTGLLRMTLHVRGVRARALLAAAIVSLCAAGCGAPSNATQKQAGESPQRGGAARESGGGAGASSQTNVRAGVPHPFFDRLVAAAIERTSQQVRYDPTYFRIPYPGGDVPAEVGVCTDEVIRSYRAVGVDLQREVHEDMARHFRLYPKTWGLARPDTNIDHRRVPNLMVFFSRKGERLPVTASAKDYRPGDVVTWDLGGGLTHIGIVVNMPSTADAERFQIVHNIGAGPKMEDVLFAWKITGHYRYAGPAAASRD
jgi:uncharacterized protein YijF (DUF1287 family)